MPAGGSKSKILQAALEMASRDGLEGITIGRLAKKLEISKSGVIGQFGNKETLQSEIVRYAASLFNRQIILPNSEHTPGLARLQGMLDCWQRYASGQTGFSGGCFFIAAAAEYDAKPGPVRDLVMYLGQKWLGAIESEIATAIENGQLSSTTDAQQLAFEIHGMLLQANWSLQLLGDTEAMPKLAVALTRMITPGSQFYSPIN